MIMVAIVPDSTVVIDGVPHSVDCSSFAGMHAIRWDGQNGEIEFETVNGVKEPPSKFTDVSPFQSLIDAWNVANTPPAPAPWTKDQLIAYAQGKQLIVACGGFTVNANPSGAALNVSVATGSPYDNYLSSAVQLAQMMLSGVAPSQNISWDQSSGAVPLTPAQVVTVGLEVAALIQQSFSVLSALRTAINAGTITTVAQIDNAAWPINN